MARKGKSMADVMSQHNRIDNLIVRKYGAAKRGSKMYQEGLARSKRVRGIARGYKDNIAKSLGGVSKVRGNMSLITRKVSRPTYMGLNNG